MELPATANWIAHWAGQVDQVLSAYMGVFFVAFVVAFAMTPLMRWLAVANGVVDWPDLKRKAHIEPVAYLGGVAIFLGWFAAIFLSLFLNRHDAPGVRVDFPMLIVFGASVIVFVGLIDDVAGVSPRVKVGGQLIAAAMLASQKAGGQMLGAQLVIKTFAVAGIDMPYQPAYILGTVIIALFVLGGCNSVNLLDGLDGLAAGTSAISALGFLMIAVFVAIRISGSEPQLAEADPQYDSVRLVMCLALLGALLGFLPYNFNPANIFMGDAGSLLIGYLCVSAMLLFAHTAAMGPFYVMACLIVFAVPITDTTLALVRRKLRGQPLFSPDREHLHHRLLGGMQRLGLGPNAAVKATVITIYAIAAMFAVLGFAIVLLRARYVLAVFMVLFCFLVVMAYKIGHQQALHTRQVGQTEAAADLAPNVTDNGPPPSA